MKTKYFEYDFTSTQNLRLYVYNANSGDYARCFLNGKQIMQCTYNCTTFQTYNHGTTLSRNDKIHIEFNLTGGLQPRVFFNDQDNDARWWFGDASGLQWDLNMPVHAYAYFYKTPRGDAIYMERLSQLFGKSRTLTRKSLNQYSASRRAV